MRHYPVKIEHMKEGGFVATFRDLPEAIAYGKTRLDAKENAVYELTAIMHECLEFRRAVPPPSDPLAGELLVELTAGAEVLALLASELLKSGLTNTALARRMGIRTKEVNRFIRTVKNPGIDTVALVLRALGKRMTLQVA